MSPWTREDKYRFRVRQIDHVELFVPDRQEAARWYERVLGLTVVQEFEFWANDSGGPLMITTPDNKTKIALFEGKPSDAGDDVGWHRVAFRVDGEGFLAFLDHIKLNYVHDTEGRKVNLLTPVDHKKSWSVYFGDPWGNRLEVTTYDYDAAADTIKKSPNWKS